MLTTLAAPGPSAILLLRSFEGRKRWLADGRLQVENTGHNRALLEKADVRFDDPLAEAKLPPEPDAVVDAMWTSVSDNARSGGTYRSKTPDLTHQTRAFVKLLGLRHGANFSETGTGKTKPALDVAGARFCRGEIDRLLIVSPKGVHRQWVDDQARKHLGVPFRAAVWPAEALPPAPDALSLFTINYEALRTRKGMEAARRFLTAKGIGTMGVLDESHLISNHKAIQHKACLLLKPFCDYRMIMTGTPIKRDLVDEWAQFQWLDENIIGTKYITTFRRDYCVMGGFQMRQVVGMKNVNRLQKLTAPYIVRTTKADIGFLPPLYSDWVVDLLPEQKVASRNLLRELELEIAEHGVLEVANAVVACGKAQQIASGFILDAAGKIHEIVPSAKNPKLRGAIEYIEALEGEQTIIWARFRYDHTLLAAALKAEGITAHSFTGATPTAERDEIVRSFNNKGVQVLLASEQTAGTGFNLQESGCSHALYYSHTDNAARRWQSEARIDRIGGAALGGSQYTNLIAKGSFDRAILRRTKIKEATAMMALDPNWLVKFFHEEEDGDDY